MQIHKIDVCSKADHTTCIHLYDHVTKIEVTTFDPVLSSNEVDLLEQNGVGLGLGFRRQTPYVNVTVLYTVAYQKEKHTKQHKHDKR